MQLLPGRKLGVAVFTNRAGAPTSILINHVFDRVCSNEPAPWLDRLRVLRRKTVAQQEIDAKTQQTARKSNTRPSHDLAEYAGNYEHSAYGRMTITRTGDDLHWAYRGLSARLLHRHYDTFQAPHVPHDLNRDRLAISFVTDRDGNIASLSARLEPMVDDIIFKRAPAGDCLDDAFRKACAGRYAHGSVAHVVSQEPDGQLTLKPDFQPLYRLRPYQGAFFSIVELDGFRLEFRRGQDGTVHELVFHQPNGVYIARRDEAGVTTP